MKRFEDATLVQNGMGRDAIRKAYFEGFNGPMGAVQWTVVRRRASAHWSAVEGWLEGSQNAKSFGARFSTWLKVHDGCIVDYVDYVDYPAIRRQVAGADPVPTVSESPVAGRRADSARALRVVEEFYSTFLRQTSAK